MTDVFDDAWTSIYIHLTHLEKRMMACAASRFATPYYNAKKAKASGYGTIHKESMRTIELAAYQGSFAQVVWCYQSGYELTIHVIEQICFRFGVEEVSYCLYHNFPTKTKRGSLCGLFALKAGNFDVYKFLYEKDPSYACSTACAEAARRNDFIFLEWLRARPGHEEADASTLRIYKTATEAAAGEGHFAMLQYLHQRGYKIDSKTFRAAVARGDAEICLWLYGQGCDYSQYAQCTLAARAGNFALVQWLREIGCSLEKSTFEEIARSGTLEQMRWLLEHGCKLTKKVFAAAMRSTIETTEKLSFLLGEGCPREKDDIEALLKTCAIEIAYLR